MPIQPPTTQVSARHVAAMAERLSDAARDRAYAVAEGKVTGPVYERARRCHERRFQALRRLAEALEAGR